MPVKCFDAGVAEYELADARILPGEFGTHQAPQVVGLGIRQPDLRRVPLDDFPGALPGKRFSREAGMYSLSAAIKASEDVG